MQIISQQGDTVDLMCWRFYGHTNSIEAVLDANTSLAFLPPMLPVGTVVVMPELTQEQRQTDIIQLWD